MGGCCCCWFSSRRSEPARTPNYYYCPRISEERQPLSADNGAPSALLVDTNLDTSIPDTYTPPPAPLPYDVPGHPQTPRGSKEIHGTKNGTATEITNSGSVEGPNDTNSPENSEEDTKEIVTKAESALELTPSKVLEDDFKKTLEQTFAIVEEEDCPVCLEEYTDENPKLLTKCEHHFHLCCILEWMERSDTCPVCDQEMVIDEPSMEA